MAETRRKSVKGYPRIQCFVHPDAFALLNRIAGPRAMGYAIEELCRQIGTSLGQQLEQTRKIEELASQILLAVKKKKPNATAGQTPSVALTPGLFEQEQHQSR